MNQTKLRKKKYADMYKINRDLQDGFSYSKVTALNACADFTTQQEIVETQIRPIKPVSSALSILPVGDISGGELSYNYSNNNITNDDGNKNNT